MPPKNSQAAEARRAALDIALQIPLHYAERGSNMARAAMAGATTLEELAHHPRNDVVDAQTQCRFFYHAHALPGAPDGWHGHFHLFVPHPGGRGFSHLAALALDAQGMPQHWFTTNRWVTGETWSPAARLRPALGRFSVQTRGRLAPVARWLNAMVKLEHALLASLLEARDRKLDALCTQQPRAQVLEDRRVHSLSMAPVQWLHGLAELQDPLPSTLQET